MPLNKVEWVRQFEISPSKKQHNGQIVYKVTSVVFPRYAPEAKTKLVIWKSMSEFKTLFVNIKMLTIEKQINKDLPCTFIDNLTSAKTLLDFIGNYPALFLSDVFQNFLKTDLTTEPFSVATDVLLPVEEHFNNNCINKSLNNNFNDQENLGEKDDEDFVVIDRPNDDCSGFEDEMTNEKEAMVVICKSEKPVLIKDLPKSPDHLFKELKRYHIVDILDMKSRAFLVRRDDKPGRRYVFKVHRRNWWREEQNKPTPMPIPVPHMARLVQFIETTEAVFEVCEYVPRGRLWSLIQTDENLPYLSEPVEQEVIECNDLNDLVANAQRLMASVSKTLNRSDQATNSLKIGIENVEQALSRRACPKQNKSSRRSKSASGKRRFERRLSSDDISSAAKGARTAQPSLDRSTISNCNSSCENRTIIPEYKVRFWMAQLITAIDTLHSQGIIWRDLNPRNLLVDERGNLILTFQHQWQGIEKTIDQSAFDDLYVAPELQKVVPPTTVCDWWSVGAICYELLTGVPLIQPHPNGFECYTCLFLPDFLSIEAASLLKELLQYEPVERLGGSLNGSEDIKCHPFFKSVNWCEAAELF